MSLLVDAIDVGGIANIAVGSSMSAASLRHRW